MATSVDLSDLEDQYGLPPGLLSAVMHVESRGNPEAIGPQTKSGERAQGAFQFMPATAKQYGVEDPFDLAQSATGAAKYFADLSKRSGGDLPTMLASYNWGPGNVANKGVDAAPAETQKYIKDVQSKMSVDPADVLPVGGSDVVDPSDVIYHAGKSADSLNAPSNYLPSSFDVPAMTIPGTATTIPGFSIPAGSLPDSLKAGVIGAGKATARLGQGIKQKYYELTGQDRPQNLSDLVTGQTPASQLATQVASEDAAYKPIADEYPLATGIGESAPAMAIPIGASKLAYTVLKSAVANALPSLLSYGTDEQRLKEGGLGAVGGAAGGAAGALVGRLINPVRAADPAAANELLALGKKYGINLTAPEYTGSKPLNALYSTMATFPGSAGTMAKVAEANSGAFNKAAFGTIGEAGMLSPEGNIPFDATARIAQNFGPKYAAATGGVAIPLDETLVNDLANVDGHYAKNLAPDQKPRVSAYIDDIMNQGPSFTGEDYQRWRSRIGAQAAGTSDSEYKGALNGIKSALDAAFKRNAPAAQGALFDATNSQYRNFSTLEPLIDKASLSTDNLSPAQVAAKAIASGNRAGSIGDLAKLGTVLKDYPNSGTAPRMMFQKLLENPSVIAGGLGGTYGAAEGGPVKGAEYGGIGALGARAFPYLLAKAMTSRPGNQYLSRGLLGLSVSPSTEQLLMKLGGLLGAGATSSLALR